MVTSLRRKEDWQKCLSEYITERRHAPFQWGVNDCLAFVAKGVERLTGTDFYKDYSDYNDEASANNMLSRNGGVEGIINACLGQGRADYMKAKRGDVVIVQAPLLMAGLVDDSGQYVMVVSERGMIKLPLRNIIKYWSY